MLCFVFLHFADGDASKTAAVHVQHTIGTLFFLQQCSLSKQLPLVSPAKRPSEERALKFHADDVSLPRSGESFWFVTKRAAREICFHQSKELFPSTG